MLKCKKIFFILMLIIIMIENISYASEITLDKIVEKFNNCSTVNEYKEFGIIINATNEEKSITISYKYNNKDILTEFKLEGNILSTTVENENNNEEAIAKAMSASILCDAIGQLHGYKDGELFPLLNSEQVKTYSIENEGLEMKESADGKKVTIKIDISKKIPLESSSNGETEENVDTYIKVSDLEDIKEFISGDGFAENKRGNVWINKSGYNGENTLLVAEKKEFTENSYKSILSFIQVMFDSEKVVDYFKENYKSISVGDKEFSGFKIEVNPEKTDYEEQLVPSDSGYKFMRITIDKNMVNSILSGNLENNRVEEEQEKQQNNNANEQEIHKEDNSTHEIKGTENRNVITKEDLPSTGKNSKIAIMCIGVVIISIIIFIKIKTYKDVK